MALLFMDSFDHYVTAGMLSKWTYKDAQYFGSIAINSSGGRHSSGSMRYASSNSNSNAYGGQHKALSPAPADTVGIMGFSITMPAGLASTSPGFPIAAFCDGPYTAPQVTLRVNSDMTLSVLRGKINSGNVIAGPSTAVLPTVAAYVEWKVTVHPSAGTVDVRINGTSVLSVTGVNTRNTAATQWTSFILGPLVDGPYGIVTGLTANVDFDDLYVLDGSGAAPWNAFIGDIRVDPRIPTAASANGATNTQWTPSTGSNYQNVDDTLSSGPNDDTDYNSATSAGLTDTFVFQDTPTAGVTVYGIQHCIYAKKTDAGTCSIAPVVRCADNSAVVADRVAADQALSTSYNYVLLCQQTNPGKSAQWTEADFNAAEFGYKRTA